MADDKKNRWNWDLFDKKIDKDKFSDEDPDTNADSTRTGEVSTAELEKLRELMDRAIPMIEQVNSLYNQYRVGVDKKPPNERRNNLEQIMTSIQGMRKPTETIRFQVRQIVSRYITYRERWERMLRAMESSNDPRFKRRYYKKAVK